MNEGEQTKNAFSAPNRRDAYLKARAETPKQDTTKEEAWFSLPEIDGVKYDPMSLPNMAMPEKDPIVGRDELGFNIRETVTGVKYQVQPVNYRDVGLSERVENITENVGAAYEAVRDDPLGTATGLAKGIAQGIASTVSSFSDPNATKQDAMNLAGMMMGASAPRLLDVYDPNVTRIFAGENAKNFPRGKKARAQRLLDRGEDPQKIYEETGIEFLPQTEYNFMRPVFNIDPEGMSVRDFDALQQVIPSTSADQLAKGESGVVKLPIKDVVDFSEFYDNYPQVEDFEVAFDPNLSKGSASFNAYKKILSLSMDNLDDTTPDEIRNILLHELQHGVQAVEGTPGGASPKWFLARSLETNPRTGEWEEIGPWRTAAKDMSEDVDELNKLEQASKDAMKAYITGNSNNLSSEKLDKLARKVDSAVKAFEADRDRLERLAFRKYEENQGEIEARAAQLWAKLTPEERLKTKPSDIYNRISDNFGTPYARLGEEPSYGDNYMPTERLPLSTNKKPTMAEGGMVEEEQMNRLMQEGGMADDGMSREPVTGNDIPPGALASEVRDNVDAKLSGGEYVVPADVLRYYGVRFFEDLRAQAKQGMMEMESEGRIGGVPVDNSGVPVEGQDEELTPEEEQMLAQAMSLPSGMAEGGVAFDRTEFTMPSYGTTGVGSPVEERLYFNPTTGKKMNISFMSGTAMGSIPPGFVPWTQLLQDTYDANKSEEKPKSSRKSRDDNRGDTTPSTAYSSWADQNYEAITSNPFEFGMNALQPQEEADSKGLAGGLIGILTGKDKDIQNIANANAALKIMESKGLTGSENYKILTEKVKAYIAQISPLEQGLVLSKVAGTGNAYMRAIEEKAKQTPATTPPAASPVTTPPAAAAPAARSSGGQSADERREGTGTRGGGGVSSVGGSSGKDRIGSKPVTTSSQGGGNYSSSTYGSGSAGYTPVKPKTTSTGPAGGPIPTPKPVTGRPGSERFAEGGLVVKPKKTNPKSKGLGGKQ